MTILQCHLKLSSVSPFKLKEGDTMEKCTEDRNNKAKYTPW